jgi:flagellar hook-associated protein 3 FlgL
MNISSTMPGYIKEANVSMDRVSNQLASGEKQTLTTAEYGQKLKLDDNIHDFKKINESLTITKSQNDIADNVMSEMKDIITSFKSKMMLSNNVTTSDSNRDSIAEDLRNYKDAMVDIANTQVMGQSIFSGKTKWEVPAFEASKDSDGHYNKVTYKGSSKHFEQTVDLKYSTRNQGLTGLELFDGLVDINLKNQNGDAAHIFNENGQLNKIADGGLADKYYMIDPNDITKSIEITQENYDDLKDITIYPDDGNGTADTTKPIDIANLQPKILYELDQAIESIDNNEVVDIQTGRSISKELGKMDTAVYEKISIQHSNLGNSSAIFDRVYDQNEYKINSLDQVLQETVGIDIAEQSIKMQQLELMYSAMFSTLQQVNQIEKQLINSL